MVVFVSGMFRSGSTWSFNIARELLLTRFDVSQVKVHASDNASAILGETDPPAGAVLLKGHLFDPAARSLVSAGTARIIHTYRDPADALLSGKRAFPLLPFAECLEWVARSFEWNELIQSARNGCLIHYDDIAERPVELVTGIAAYLGIAASPASIAALAERFDRASVQSFTDELAADRTLRPVVDTGFSYYDRDTLLYKHHVSDGEYLRNAALSPEEMRALVARLGTSRITRDGRLTSRESRVWMAGHTVS